MRNELRSRWLPLSVMSLLTSLALFVAACDGGTETVEVEVTREVETTVEVTREVPGAERTVVVQQTVVATPTQSPPTEQPASSGQVIVADSTVFPIIFVHALSGLGQEWKLIGWDIGENLVRVDENGEYDADNSIARAWTASEDLSSITFDLRDDVEFHDGWGTVTAEDVAWSFNNAMREGSVYYRVASLQPYMESWEALDEHTVRLNWKEGQYLPWWLTNFSQIASADPWITSKKIVDELGEARASQVPVATGPYRVETWRVGERMDLQAVPNHWRITPEVENFRVLELREPSTMVAAFKTGEIDFAPIPNSLLQDAVDSTPGATKQTVGLSQMGCVNFTGNYWQEKINDPASPEYGQTVFPRPGFDPSHPWVGDPRDPDSMEQARKVRRALSLAIDREAIRDELFGGFGGTQGTAVTGWGPGMAVWDTKWERHYDPDEARQLLDEAGYSDGFTIPFFVPADHPRINPEAGEAIAQMWSDIGVSVDLDISAYAAARPRRFGGVDDIPWYHCGTINPATVDRPFDGGMGPTNTFRGFEVEDHIALLYFENFAEPSREKRIENNRQAVDYVIGWELQTTFVADQPHYAVGPDIASWSPHAIDAPIFTNAATVKLK